MKFGYKIYNNPHPGVFSREIFVAIKDTDPYFLTEHYKNNPYTMHAVNCYEEHFSHMASPLELVIYGIPYEV